MEGRGVLQDIIPDVGQLKLAQVPNERWIIDPYEYGFLNDPGNAVHFLTTMEKLSTLMQCLEE